MFISIIITVVCPTQTPSSVQLCCKLALLQATSYLNKLPKSFSKEDKILVADPMLATGQDVSFCLCAGHSISLQRAAVKLPDYAHLPVLLLCLCYHMQLYSVLHKSMCNACAIRPQHVIVRGSHTGERYSLGVSTARQQRLTCQA